MSPTPSHSPGVCSPAPRRCAGWSILSDGSFDHAGDLAREENVELISIGKKTGNCGITRLQARRSLLDPIGYEILVEVTNASDEPASFRLELDLDDDPIDVVPMNLAAGERSVHVFEKTSAEGGRLRASIDRNDSLLTDNTAWAILPHRARQKVILVTPGNLFLEKVFEAIPLVDLQVVKVPAEGALGKEAAQSWASQSQSPGQNDGQPIVVFHHKVPDVLPPGNVFVIEPERSGTLWELGGATSESARRQARQRLAADAAHPARQRAHARSAEVDASHARPACWPSHPRATRSTRCSSVRPEQVRARSSSSQ